MADCVLHGTKVVGERHFNSKLTTVAVLEIRRLAAEGVTRAQLADLYKIGRSVVGEIVIGAAWAHVGGPLLPDDDARATLDRDKAQEIRRRYAEGATQVGLAKEFGVGQSTISRVVLGKIWP